MNDYKDASVNVCIPSTSIKVAVYLTIIPLNLHRFQQAFALTHAGYGNCFSLPCIS